MKCWRIGLVISSREAEHKICLMPQQLCRRSRARVKALPPLQKVTFAGYKMKPATESEVLRTAGDWSELGMTWHGPCSSASLVSTCKQMCWDYWIRWLDVNAGILTDFSAIFALFSIKIIAREMALAWKLSSGYQHSDSNMHTHTCRKQAYTTTYARGVSHRHSVRSRNKAVWVRSPSTSTMNK